MPTSGTYVWNVISEEAERLCEVLCNGGAVAPIRSSIDDLGDLILDRGPEISDLFRQNMVKDSDAETLVLGRRRLFEWLVVQSLNAPTIQAVLSGKNEPTGPSAREKLSLIKALASIIVSLADRLGSDDPSGVVLDTEAAIHLLSEFARREWGFEGAIDAEGDLRSFAQVEPALYLWRNAYRDHLLHVADVCLLGWLLLDSRLPGRECSLANHVGAMLGMSEKLVFGNWFLAALFHDVGYAVEAIRQAVGHVAYLRSDHLKQLRTELDEVMKGAGFSVGRDILETVPGNDGQGLDHGVIGAIHLREVLTKAIDNPRRRELFKPACRAILVHNLRNVSVLAVSEPLSALLILCDELQEWERPRINGKQLAESSREVMAGSTSDPIPTAKPSESLTLVGIKLDGEQFRFTQDILRCNLTYAPPEIGKFWPQRIRLEKCHSLQRVNPVGLPIKFQLTMINQYLPTLGATEYGFEALRNYALRCPDLGLLEFTKGSRDDIQVIDRTVEYGDIEAISFDLEQLFNFPLLPQKLSIDWNDFATWTLSRPSPYELPSESLLRD